LNHDSQKLSFVDITQFGDFSELTIQKLLNIKAIVSAVDGVLTNNLLMLDSNGEILKTFNTKDGKQIPSFRNLGFKIGFITSRSDDVSILQDFHFRSDFFSVTNNKIYALDDFCKKFQLSRDEVLYIGCDIPDIECIESCGVSICPIDTPFYIKNEFCDIVAPIKGGEGVVRFAIDIVFAAQNKFPLLLTTAIRN